MNISQDMLAKYIFILFEKYFGLKKNSIKNVFSAWFPKDFKDFLFKEASSLFVVVNYLGQL